MIIILILSVLLNLLFVYMMYAAMTKVEILEQSVEYFYSRIDITLRTMRMIDEKQMFEKDDEVGEVFSQLTNIVNDLRPILYGSLVDGETSKEQVG